MSAPLPFHTLRAEIIHLVALIPGCAMESTLSKKTCRKLAGTTGLGLASYTSHMRLLPPKGRNFIFSEVAAAISCVSVHSA
jgi:hypothetical protein